jgi:hypothetical protein
VQQQPLSKMVITSMTSITSINTHQYQEQGQKQE